MTRREERVEWCTVGVGIVGAEPSVMAERKRERRIWNNGRERERERENRGEVGPSNGNNCEFSSDLDLAWIQKQLINYSQIWHGTHIKLKLEFQTSLKFYVPNMIFFNGTQWLWIAIIIIVSVWCTKHPQSLISNI